MNRRRSKFERFCRSYGVEKLAAGLGVRSSAIYHWIRGAHWPRPPFAFTIQRLARKSGVKLTLEQIYQHATDLRPAVEHEIYLTPERPREHATAALPSGLGPARRLWTKKARRSREED